MGIHIIDGKLSRREKEVEKINKQQNTQAFAKKCEKYRIFSIHLTVFAYLVSVSLYLSKFIASIEHIYLTLMSLLVVDATAI